MAESAPAEVSIKEGFLCPVCHKDLRSAANLLAHFQDLHSDKQDLLKSIKDLVVKAKKRILKLDEEDLEQFKSEISLQKYYIEDSEPQEPGQFKSHTAYFKSVRRERLDHRATETNRLIIKLDRLLGVFGPDRKQHEQELVTWLDGSVVSRCPSCAASFNITRRQHHCRLCGSIMCNSCSCFLPYETAKSIVAPVYETGSSAQIANKTESETIRTCNHCMNMLECRRHVQMRQNAQPLICSLYTHLQKLRSQIQPSVDLYQKMYSSLTSGDSTFQLQDAQALRGTIAKQAEKIDAISKQIATIPPDPETPRVYHLQNMIRHAASQYIKESLLTMPNLQTHAELEKFKRERTQKNVDFLQPIKASTIKKVAVTTGWSPANITVENVPETSDDPLIQQMNIVRNYIEQARKAQRVEEVVSLQENLKLLKETYHSQLQKAYSSKEE